MLMIRGDQLNALAQGQRDAFERRLVAWLQQIYSGDRPDQIATNVLLPRVRKIIERAKSHRIDEEPDVTLFVEIAFEVGDEFDADPDNEWAAEILTDAWLSSHDKVVAMQSILEQADEIDALEAATTDGNSRATQDGHTRSSSEA